MTDTTCVPACAPNVASPLPGVTPPVPMPGARAVRDVLAAGTRAYATAAAVVVTVANTSSAAAVMPAR